MSQNKNLFGLARPAPVIVRRSCFELPAWWPPQERKTRATSYGDLCALIGLVRRAQRLG